MGFRSTIAILLTAGLSLASGGAWAQDSHEDLASDWFACVEAAEQVGAAIDAPAQLLTAVALNETARRSPTGDVAPWPWTINVGGRGYVFATKDQAVFAAQQLIASGTRSFDVGCMQVNVFFHPRAFTSFEEAFDPLSNVLYAADYLHQLRARSGSWDRAVELYHSYTEEYNQVYGARFQNFLTLARRRVANGDVLMTTRPLGDVIGDDQGADIRLIGGPDEGGDFAVLLGERDARFGAGSAALNAGTADTPMVAALLASIGGEANPAPALVQASLDLRTAAIVRRIAEPASDEAGS